MSSVLLAGAFGQGNPGDEALLDAFLRELAGDDVVVASRDPGATSAVHGCDAFAIDDRFAALRALRRADVVVVGGGTVFKRLHPSAMRHPDALLTSTLLLVSAARAAGRPVALMGVGAGDLTTPTSARLARALVRFTDLLVLRDEESALTLERIGATPPFRVGADAAWSLIDIAPPRIAPPPSNRVVVALSRHVAADLSTFTPTFASSLRDVTRGADALTRPRELVLQPWEVDDLPLAESIAGALAGDDVRIGQPPATFADAVVELSSADLVIGLRFHALVAAAAAGRPFVAIAHEPKLAALARRLGQPSILPAPASCGTLAAAATDALATGGPAWDAVQREIERAEQGFRLLRLLLDRGSDDDLATLPNLDLVPQRWTR